MVSAPGYVKEEESPLIPCPGGIGHWCNKTEKLRIYICVIRETYLRMWDSLCRCEVLRYIRR